MFNLFKNKEVLLKEKTQKILHVNSVNKVICIKEVTSIAVLATNAILEGVNLEELIKKTMKVNDVSVFGYRKYQKDDPVLENSFTEKDISKKGEILQPELQEFLSKDYNVLIAFFDVENSYLEYVSALANAKYKVGFPNVNDSLLDLEILIDINHPESFLLEAKKYITILSNS